MEISEGGVSAYLRGEFEAGQQVELELDLPTGPLELSAIVRNCLGHRYGFQFLELLPEQCQKIQASCKGCRIGRACRRNWRQASGPKTAAPTDCD